MGRPFFRDTARVCRFATENHLETEAFFAPPFPSPFLVATIRLQETAWIPPHGAHSFRLSGAGYGRRRPVLVRWQKKSFS